MATPTTFDRRIVTPETLRFPQACQARVPYHLGGGAALAGVLLRHRLSRDADLFFHDRVAHRDAVRLLPEISREAGITTRIVQVSRSEPRDLVDRLPRSGHSPAIRR